MAEPITRDQWREDFYGGVLYGAATLTKRPPGGFAATLKADRMRGYNPADESDRRRYYTTRMMARIDPNERRRLLDHLDAELAWKKQTHG